MDVLGQQPLGRNPACLLICSSQALLAQGLHSTDTSELPCPTAAQLGQSSELKHWGHVQTYTHLTTPHMSHRSQECSRKAKTFKVRTTGKIVLCCASIGWKWLTRSWERAVGQSSKQIFQGDEQADGPRLQGRTVAHCIHFCS